MHQQYKEVSILLVEDDDLDAISVERSCRKLKIANPIIRAKNGIEALKLMRGGDDQLQRPYIVLLDLNMPLMGGLEFLHIIRDDDELRDTVVFVLTTSEADEDRITAYNKNVAGYMVKSNVDNEFNRVISMLDQFCRVVLLPR